MSTAEPVPSLPPANPCDANPCGLHSTCRVVQGRPACTCKPGFIGRPPNCRPECTISAECPSHLACIKDSCRDPCPGSCGPYASCRCVAHNPVCSCFTGYSGDPFSGCSFVKSELLVSKNTQTHTHILILLTRLDASQGKYACVVMVACCFG